MNARVDPSTLTYPHQCLCGCRQITPVAPYSKPTRNWVKGLPMAFMPHHSKMRYPLIDGHKTCGGCKRTLPLSAFWKNKACGDKHMARCKECSKAGVYDWRKGNVQYIAYRQGEDLKKYKLTQVGYDTLLLAQDGVCAICAQPERARYKGTLRRLSVDHCHETGRVRGLLCTPCNRGLGYLGDNMERLEKAVLYLKK